MITVMVADDHEVVRRGVRAMLDAEHDLEVIAEAADGIEAVRIATEKRPNVLVVDLFMPGLRGTDVVRDVVRSAPRTRCIVLTMSANESYVVEALRAGAAGYVLKDASGGELARAIRDVAAGRQYLGGAFSEHSIELYAARAQSTPMQPYDFLTSREREVLHLIAAGHSNAEIADRLAISPRTVETHRANLMRKLGVRNTAELVVFAVRQGMVQR